MSILMRPPKRKWGELETREEHQRDHDSTVASRAQSAIPTSTDTAIQREMDNRQHVEQLMPPGNSVSRESNGNRASPVVHDAPFPSQRSFDENASIVLVGIRGTGKSSLAVMLAATSGRRLIDADQYFQQITGRSRAAFKRDYDLAEYRQQEARVMESMLVEHTEGCVIACGPGSMERSGQRLLREYSRTHPVIHILRDPESIQSYLQAWDTDKVRRVLELSGPVYRACSNLEFFNASETGAADYWGANGQHHSQLELELDHRSQTSTPFLTLKRVQRDFLRFIAFATGDATDMNNQRASFPLTMLPIESRTFTYAVSVPMSSLVERCMDIEDLESTADAFELKLDMVARSTDAGVDSSLADRISQTTASIRRNIIVPLIYHVESYTFSGDPDPYGNHFLRRSDEAYLGLVQHGLRIAPEFLTVDLSYSDAILSRIIASKGLTRIIGNYTPFEPAPGGWDGTEYMAIYERARKLGCDIVRMSQPAETMEDNFAVQRFRHRTQSLPEPHLPLTAYNSGPLGRLSCCFNPILTPVTHPSLMAEPQTKMLPCLTMREAQEALYASFALDPMQYFVFGANVTYSLSPAMHNTAYKQCGIPHVYDIHQSQSLRGLNDLVENPHFGGSSVSLPYKTEVIPLLHSMSPHARAIGAVNTLIPIRRLSDPLLGSHESTLHLEKSRAGPIKALHGDNTDWIGIGNCIRRGLSPANAVRPSSTGLVIGAGGMARAAVYSMIHLGVRNIFVYNRSIPNAEKLAHHYNRQYLGRGSEEPHNNMPKPKPTLHVLPSRNDPWPTASFKQPTIVVSCIPAHSIAGQPAPDFEMPAQWLGSPTGGVVVEVCPLHIQVFSSPPLTSL
jgi:shikimate 5-dehydrogenase/shikimate kinase/3-dehydroquinate dehydratase